MLFGGGISEDNSCIPVDGKIAIIFLKATHNNYNLVKRKKIMYSNANYYFVYNNQPQKAYPSSTVWQLEST